MWKGKMKTAFLIVTVIIFLIRLYCGEETYRFDTEINQLVVGNNAVYVAAAADIYQLSRTLHCELRKRVSAPRTNMLLPYEHNRTLVACGSRNCGACEVLDLNNISKTIFADVSPVVPVGADTSSVGFLVKTPGQQTYLAVGAAHALEDQDCRHVNRDQLITLRDTTGENIFSAVGSGDTPSIKLINSTNNPTQTLQFIDGFQVSDRIFFVLNVKKSSSEKVRLLWIQVQDDKGRSLGTLRGATLQCCGDKARAALLSSSLVRGGTAVLWAGVFTAGDRRDPDNTALGIFNITSMDKDVPTDRDPDFCFSTCNGGKNPEQIEPKGVAFLHPKMMSVATATVSAWTVLFIGTGDGQLLKIVMDQDLQFGCPDILYESSGDRAIFPRMLLDPVDKTYIFMASENKLSRIRVANCSKFGTLAACWSAQDPYCGWCARRNRCSFEEECSRSVWISIPDGSFKETRRITSYQVEDSSSGKTKVQVRAHLKVMPSGVASFTCRFTLSGDGDLCDAASSSAVFPMCSCIFPNHRLVPGGLNVTVKMVINSVDLSETLTLRNCSHVGQPPTPAPCTACIAAGCSWSLREQRCSSSPAPSHVTQTQNSCPIIDIPGDNSTIVLKPEIHSMEPQEITYLGKAGSTIKGRNLSQVVKIRLKDKRNCAPIEVPVLMATDTEVQFSIPRVSKGVRTVCVALRDGSCYGSVRMNIKSLPSCQSISPRTTWASGQRKIQITGQSFDLVDSLKIANEHKDLIYNVKKTDALNITVKELSIIAIADKEYPCKTDQIQIRLNNNSGDDSIICVLSNKRGLSVQQIKITLGGFSIVRGKPINYYWLLGLILVFMPFILLAMFCFNRIKQKQMSKKLSEQVELLECDIRKEIRDGFAELQTEKSDLIEAFGTIPYLDYKHFAIRTFFPETGPSQNSFVNDVSQDSEKVKQDECSQAISDLIHDQPFLITLVHTLEEQKKFDIKQKCMFASLLSIALHSDLVYLTSVMEDLLIALMDQNSNAQPKLMLRRTESIVEKLLTNWMSMCLYGFLRESVGEPLFLMVSALIQRINKGPVDAITDKALYTLNEDWLLWQAQDFNTLKLKVSFQVIPDSDSDAGTTLDVSVLDCDTIEQAKEKILRSFKSKFGHPYHVQFKDIDLEYVRDPSEDSAPLRLREVDPGPGGVEHGGVKMLNTLGHYKIEDGASIRVTKKKPRANLSTQNSIRDEDNYSTKYCHLIEADLPETDDLQNKNPKRKKLKLKEVYLTKLLGTKVAVHSFVENLFCTIWGMPNNRVPPAVKYFFDFLDTEADKRKISDPDVLHIWKTNSLPLRFWVNILKNPQFVFDMEKTAHLDSCLSVIAQAFMDSFSLTEQQLGKHAPTNKLLYAKDIPKYKEEVKAYYKHIGELPAHSATEFRAFLLEESKKHENEFNESAALCEIYKYILKYFDEIQVKLDQIADLEQKAELKQKLNHVKDLFDERKRCKWE
ncbi:plexin-C1 isoform X2 [Amia ocellicauda]|uniref:plexin-C1 isoform X2 n=1 Tax=Amia ocellicauda TaxID=2972642 RepID=UPI0034648C70